MRGKRAKRNLVFVCVASGTLAIAGARARADFIFGPAQNAGPAINTSLTEIEPTPEPLSLWLVRRSGPGGAWEYWRASRSAEDAPWEMPVNLGAWDDSYWNLVETLPKYTTADGLELYFYAGALPGGHGGYDIWMKKRESIDDDWGPTVNVGATVNSAYAEAHPAVSPDGLELYFSGWGQQNRPGGQGERDLWVARRSTRDEAWGEPLNLGPTVNTASHDQRPVLVGDGLLLFFESNRPGGFGSVDLYLMKRASLADPWSEPVNLGPAVNSASSDEQGFLSPDGTTLYFHSNRPGGYGIYDIWQAPLELVVDFNGDGAVDGAEVLAITASWGLADSLCDIAPTPFGDGIVDLQDVVAVADYIGTELVDPTLVAHWTLDEAEGMVATDSAGENDGTVMGNPVWLPDDGHAGGAVRFDGVDDLMLADAPAELGDGPFSVCLWIRGTVPGRGILFAQGGTRWLYTDALDGSLATDLSAPAGPPQPMFSDVVVTDGQWHRICLVWDGADRILYVDDEEVAREALAEVAPPTASLLIGAGGISQSGSVWSGLIDDVRIYNRVVRP